MKKNYLRKVSLLAVCSVVTSLVWAEPVSENMARRIASKYLASPELRQSAVITRAAESHEQQPAYYLFTNVGDDKYVVVSGESRLPTNLLSKNSKLCFNAMKEWFGRYVKGKHKCLR